MRSAPDTTGNYILALLASGLRMCGVDVSSVMLEAARRKSDETEWILADGADLPIPDGRFCLWSRKKAGQRAKGGLPVKRCLQRLVDHVEWVDAQNQKALQSTGGKPEEAARLLAHVPAAERVWLM